jgi:hypothetical protein
MKMSASLAIGLPAAPVREEVVSKAVARAAALLGITNATLAHTLGVSEATASRLRAGHYIVQSGSKQYEFSLLLIRVFRSLDAIMGGEKASVQSWIKAENHALGGVPAELMQSVTGLVAMVEYVDAARARV